MSSISATIRGLIPRRPTRASKAERNTLPRPGKIIAAPVRLSGKRKRRFEGGPTILTGCSAKSVLSKEVSAFRHRRLICQHKIELVCVKLFEQIIKHSRTNNKLHVIAADDRL